MGQIQGFGRIWSIEILGEWRSTHHLRVRLAKNHKTTYFQDKSWPSTPTTVGEPLQVEHRPSVQEMESIRIRLTATVAIAGVGEGGAPVTLYSAPTGESLKLTSIALNVGLEQHLMRLPGAQRQ